MKSILRIGVVSLALLGGACSALGPKPEINVIKAEVNKVKNIKGVVVADLIGLEPGSSDAMAFLGATALTYPPPKGVPMEAARKIISPIGLSDDASKLLLSAYQVEFLKVASTFEKAYKDNKKAKMPESMKMPAKAKGVDTPKSIADAKALKPRIEKLQSNASSLVTAINSGHADEAEQSFAQNKDLAELLNEISKVVIKQSKSDYILLSKLNGTKADYDSGKPILMTAALVNAKTGKFRYFATVEGKKGSIPLPFNVQLTQMANSLLSGADEAASPNT